MHTTNKRHKRNNTDENASWRLLIRNRIRTLMNRTPLWLLFTVIVAIMLLVLTIILCWSNYSWSTKNAIKKQNETTSQLIDLKLQNIDQYLDDLSDFCILPVYDSNLYGKLMTREMLGGTDLSQIKDDVTEYFYTRSDVTSYQIYLLHQNAMIGRKPHEQHMKIYQNVDISKDESFISCCKSASGYIICPSENSGSLFRFCHTIIRINDRTPVAYVCVEVDKRLMSSGFKNQITAMYGSSGELLYTNAPADIRSDIADRESGIDTISEAGTGSTAPDTVTELGGKKYMCVSGSNDSGISLVVFTPLTSITKELNSIRRFTFLQGLLFMVFSLAIIYAVLRYLTAPLSVLADSQTAMSTGRFPKISIGRCKETSDLCTSFNDMSEHIDKLVNENLRSKINEKTAQLTALEAQVDPHFLNNTLQAIGSEALMNGQPEIYDMVTKLATNLRYTIKAPNEVTLDQELLFSENYIALQKIRMDDRLIVEKNVDTSLYNTIVPKCSLQTIIENSVKYGICGEISSITVKIDIYRKDNKLIISVKDNGAGMTHRRLEMLNNEIHDYVPGDITSSIGLANLYSRLLIMYDNQADIKIESSCGEDHFTRTTLIIPDTER